MKTCNLRRLPRPYGAACTRFVSARNRIQATVRVVRYAVGDVEHVAADWIPHEAFADENPLVPPAVASAAMDCPAGLAWGCKTGPGETRRYGPGKLRLIYPRDPAGESYIVM